MFVSYSDKFNYHIQHSIFSYMDEATQKTEWLRTLAFLGFCTGTLTSLVLQITCLAEVTLLGLGTLLIAPFSQNPVQQIERGWMFLKQASYEILGVVVFSFIQFIADSICAVGEPKFYILQGHEFTKVTMRHLKTGTIGDDQYHHEVSEASGTAKRKLLEWQRKQEKLAKAKIA